MRSRSAAAWLRAKEWRELMASRAWWVMFVLIGPLVGFSFISAMWTYAEASGLNGTSAGVGEAFSPLVGVWAPTFSACELAAAFLLPFVAIRLVAGDRQSGALKLELQHPFSAMQRMSAKALVLAAGWLAASIPIVLAIALWKLYGGFIYWPELGTAFTGHLLNAGLTIALGAATASIAEHPATAAILTLSVTVGTWIVNFVAAVQGGAWAVLARYTPTAMVAEFQRGLIRLDVVLVALALIVAGLLLAAIWMRSGVAERRRAWESIALAMCALLTLSLCSLARASWDSSESRANSFSRADERALRAIGMPLTIEVHLAPEDPRRVDLEHRGLAKLARVMPELQVRYVSQTSIGLFEQSREGYGEIWYDLGGRRAMTRATTEESVLETIYELAGVPAPEMTEVFRGHPLASAPAHAPFVFYAAWPAAALATAFYSRRRHA
ncbi:MAG TPA: ABC transporter permease subunit [Vicinamibacterales bacterium]